MGRRKIEIRVHPLLDELRPRLKRSARKDLETSLIRVGQLSEVLVTADDYILDGRDRYELVKELGMEPRIHRLTMHSGIGNLPSGYNRDEELEMCREVIEETSRGAWRETLRRRPSPLPEGPVEMAVHELITQPTDGNPIGVRVREELREYLQRAARATPAARGKCRGHEQTSLSLAEYIRKLCEEDFKRNGQPTAGG